MPSGSFDSRYGEHITSFLRQPCRIGRIKSHDIESIEILKDASAAIYGIGAADGVILVTTKKEKKETDLVYEGSYSIQKHYPYLEVLMGPE
jgi:TonB-dependent SusC/RagA subfamily outer membrane receptor